MTESGDSVRAGSDNGDTPPVVILAASKADKVGYPDDEATAAKAKRQRILDKLTKERNAVLDRWADAETLGLTDDEAALNVYQKAHLKFLFGQTGFNPPVPARNPVSVSMHNPRFAAALWAINTEAYRRKGKLSRSQKEVIALGISLSNNCPHCAFIHTAMGSAAGSDVQFNDLQRFYQTGDADAAFAQSEEGEGGLNHELASWSVKHRDGDGRGSSMPCTPEQLPEVLGTVMLFAILNRIVDSFVSKTEAGPMFPSPVRALMRFKTMTPIVQRMMSSMMSWMMHDEDSKVEAGQVLREINKVYPIIYGYEGCTHETPLELPEELKWAESDETICTSLAFLDNEAYTMSAKFIPGVLAAFIVAWVSLWDGTKPAADVERSEWLEPAVKEGNLGADDESGKAMLRLMLVTVVASDTTDDNLLSECQEHHGIRGTHAAVLYAAYLAAQRLCQLAVASFDAPDHCSIK